MKRRDMTAITVLIACYNGRAYLDDCLGSIFASLEPDVALTVVVVDNASQDGSADFVQSAFPQAHLVRLSENLGFAGGNNAGWSYIQRQGIPTDYLAIVNQDIVAQSGWLSVLAAHLENRPAVAAAQGMVFRWPQRQRINTAGNQSHFMGFGFVTGYDQLTGPQFEQTSEIDFPSGAAMLLRADAVRRAGLFDELFFLYLEDAELGWKLRQLGYRIEFVPGAPVWHKYTFQQNYQHYYSLERNRWYLLATYYKTPTLLLLAPALAAMEIGQLYFACRTGVLKQKLRAWSFFLCSGNISRLLKHRRQAQRRRRITDRAFTRNFTSRAQFPELKSRMLDRIGNPILHAYWQVVRRFIWW